MEGEETPAHECFPRVSSCFGFQTDTVRAGHSWPGNIIFHLTVCQKQNIFRHYGLWITRKERMRISIGKGKKELSSVIALRAKKAEQQIYAVAEKKRKMQRRRRKSSMIVRENQIPIVAPEHI